MKREQSGLVRRLDSLGRIVLPKEYRDILHIHDGDPLTIAISDNTVRMEKYQPLNQLVDVSDAFLKAFATTCGGGTCLICNTERVISTRGVSVSDTQLLSPLVQKYIHEQRLYVSGDPATAETSDPMTLFGSSSHVIEALYPIGTPGNSLGAVILLQYRRATSLEMVSAKLIATMLTELLSEQ